MSVVVFGGHGTFGSLLVAELPGAVPVGRRTGHDVRDAAACARALEGRRVAVNCAGPFQDFDDTLARACLDAGCHYVDIADDRAYCASIRALDGAFRERGLTAAYGCSSLPGISGALAALVKPTRARVTLFIGNKNPKGAAAVASFARGRFSLRDGADVELPQPFGRRRVYFDLDSPDKDLIDADEVIVKVGFESRLGTWLMPLLGPRILAFCARLFPFGSSGGAVMVEDLDSGRREAVVARENGQRLAILPAVCVVRALEAGGARPGAHTAAEVLGAEALLAALS